MKAAYQQNLKEVLSDLQTLLKKKKFIFKRETEPDPFGIDLSFTVPVAGDSLDKLVKPGLCTLCDRRISYKHRQFANEAPQKPFLILKHNSFLGEHNRYYQDPAVNTMFEKMIQAGLESPPNAFLVREILRCHFGAEDLMNPVWTEHCAYHILEDIKRHNLKGILLVGKAAALAYRDPKERAQKLKKVFEFHGSPAVLTPGPDSVVEMQQKGVPVEKINAQKRLIYESLVLFRKEVIGSS